LNVLNCSFTASTKPGSDWTGPDRITDRIMDRIMDGITDRTMDRPMDRPMYWTTDQTMDRTTDQTTDWITDKRKKSKKIPKNQIIYKTKQKTKLENLNMFNENMKCCVTS